MAYLIDTDIFADMIRGKDWTVANHFKRLKSGEATISAVSVAELWCGVHKAQHFDKSELKLVSALVPMKIIEFCEPCAEVYGYLRGTLEKQGITVAHADLQIAATALHHQITLVTANTKHFSHIPQLKQENWRVP